MSISVQEYLKGFHSITQHAAATLAAGGDTPEGQIARRYLSRIGRLNDRSPVHDLAKVRTVLAQQLKTASAQKRMFWARTATFDELAEAIGLPQKPASKATSN